MKKIIVLIGSYGSGKTELAINFAFSAARDGRVLLIDLDMVNTYFRLTEMKDIISRAGIRLISPNFAMTNVETLSLPAQISSAFHSDWDTVVFDVGGDSAGATALGRYKPDFDALREARLEVFNVVNIRRPLCETPEKLLSLTRELEAKSRLKTTGFINNTNLSVATGPAELRDGFAALRAASELSGIPVAYTAGKRELLAEFLREGHAGFGVGTPLQIETYTRRDWESFVKFSPPERNLERKEEKTWQL